MMHECGGKRARTGSLEFAANPSANDAKCSSRTATKEGAL